MGVVTNINNIVFIVQVIVYLILFYLIVSILIDYLAKRRLKIGVNVINRYGEKFTDTIKYTITKHWLILLVIDVVFGLPGTILEILSAIKLNTLSFWESSILSILVESAILYLIIWGLDILVSDSPIRHYYRDTSAVIHSLNDLKNKQKKSFFDVSLVSGELEGLAKTLHPSVFDLFITPFWNFNGKSIRRNVFTYVSRRVYFCSKYVAVHGYKNVVLSRVVKSLGKLNAALKSYDIEKLINVANSLPYLKKETFDKYKSLENIAFIDMGKPKLLKNRMKSLFSFLTEYYYGILALIIIIAVILSIITKGVIGIPFL